MRRSVEASAALEQARVAYRQKLNALRSAPGPVTSSEQTAIELARAEMIAAYDMVRAAEVPS